jgi:hypothetical protein
VRKPVCGFCHVFTSFFSQLNVLPSLTPQHVRVYFRRSDDPPCAPSMNVIFQKINCSKFSLCRASQKLNLASPQRRKRHGSTDDDGASGISSATGVSHHFRTDFCGLLRRNPPVPPVQLIRRLGTRENPGVGKVSCFFFDKNFVHFPPLAENPSVGLIIR